MQSSTEAADTSWRILAVDHTGFTVANVERSLAFWRDALGFQLSHRAHHTGDLASKVTGVSGAEILIAVLQAPGHRIELLEYLAPTERKHFRARACDVGSAHIALLVEELDAVVRRIVAGGGELVGEAQTLSSGPNAGRRVVYLRAPDGITIELMQLPNEKRTVANPR